MKLIQTLLTTTALVVAVSSASANHFTGTYVGAKLGASKAASQKKALISSSQGVPGGAVGGQLSVGTSSKSAQYGINGGVTVGHRMAVDTDVILGVSLGLDLENTKAKTSTNITPAVPNNANTTKFTSEVKRKFVVNLLGQAGYTVTKDFMPYVTAGLSVTQFKLSAGTGNAYTVGGTAVGGNKNKKALGYVVGAGASYAINSAVSAELQYLYTAYGRTKMKTRNVETGAQAGLVTAGTVYAPRAYHAVTVGVNYKI